MDNKRKRYFTLFTTMFHLSFFTFGGGFVIISLMQKKFVEELKWIDAEEMLNLSAIAQTSPGAVAVNSAILVGYKCAGYTGAFCSILGTVLPSFIIITIVSFFYSTFGDNPLVSAILKGMQAGVAAVIFDVVLNLGSNVLKSQKYMSLIIMICTFIVSYFLSINVLYIILVCASIGIFVAWFGIRKELK